MDSDPRYPAKNHQILDFAESRTSWKWIFAHSSYAFKVSKIERVGHFGPLHVILAHAGPKKFNFPYLDDSVDEI